MAVFPVTLLVKYMVLWTVYNSFTFPGSKHHLVSANFLNPPADLAEDTPLLALQDSIQTEDYYYDSQPVKGEAYRYSKIAHAVERNLYIESENTYSNRYTSEQTFEEDISRKKRSVASSTYETKVHFHNLQDIHDLKSMQYDKYDYHSTEIQDADYDHDPEFSFDNDHLTDYDFDYDYDLYEPKRNPNSNDPLDGKVPALNHYLLEKLEQKIILDSHEPLVPKHTNGKENFDPDGSVYNKPNINAIYVLYCLISLVSESDEELKNHTYNLSGEHNHHNNSNSLPEHFEVNSETNTQTSLKSLVSSVSSLDQDMADHPTQHLSMEGSKKFNDRDKQEVHIENLYMTSVKEITAQHTDSTLQAVQSSIPRTDDLSSIPSSPSTNIELPHTCSEHLNTAGPTPILAPTYVEYSAEITSDPETDLASSETPKGSPSALPQRTGNIPKYLYQKASQYSEALTVEKEAFQNWGWKFYLLIAGLIVVAVILLLVTVVCGTKLYRWQKNKNKNERLQASKPPPSMEPAA